MTADNLFSEKRELDLGFTPELLVILGRSVEFTVEKGRLKFRPTGIYSRWNPETRDLIPELNFANPPRGNSEDTYVSGGNSNVLGAIHYLRDLSMRGHYVKEIVFAAGRPPYLQKLTDSMTEGDIMLGRFNVLARHYSLPEVPIGNFRSNRNTWDDVKETLRLAKEKGYINVAMVSIGLHLPRIAEFIKEYESREGARLNSDLNIQLLDSWTILSEASSHYKEIFKNAEKSEAYKKTFEMEENGIRQLKNGTYKLAK